MKAGEVSSVLLEVLKAFVSGSGPEVFSFVLYATSIRFLGP